MINDILEKVFLGNTILDYAICAGIFFLSLIAIKIFKWVFIKKLQIFTAKTETTLDDFLINVLKNVAVPFSYFGALYISISFLTLSEYLQRALNILGVAALTFFTVIVMQKLITYGFTVYCQKISKTKALDRSFSGMLKVIRFVIWSLAVIFLLDNLGFKISTVIAGLGIGGVAIALAAQAVLGDLFSYFSILFDRPFEVGDFIIVGDLLGTIEHIGIKTTRVRSLGGEQLVFSNSDLTNSRIRNYKRMNQRRVVFKLGVTYDTALAKLKEIPKVIESIIKNVENTTFDRAHFFSYGDFNLIIEVVYYVMDRDYNKYMDIQQEINFAIKEEFGKRGIEFAFPTQTLYVNKKGD